jgi:FdrA protein
VASKPGAILGLYSGGTLAAEAQLILLGAGRTVTSNATVSCAEARGNAAPGSDRIIDLGADEFTRGRPHPMIDPAVRADKLRGALADVDLGVILLDVVIGLGAHPDPAGHIASALAGAGPKRPHVVASVVGTETDPQVRSRQIATLEAAGALVAASNAGAVEWALALTRR